MRKISKIMSIVNIIAGKLGHICSLGKDYNFDELPSLRCLAIAMQLQKTIYNDFLPNNEKWRSAYAEWIYDEETEKISYSTPSRLSVEASNDFVSLSFYSAKENSFGSNCFCSIGYSLSNDEWNCSMISVEHLEEKPERLALLYDFDLALDNEISVSLSKRESWASFYKENQAILSCLNSISNAIQV